MDTDVDDFNGFFFAPLSTLDLALGDTWQVVTPRVFRYMDKEFVDEFFDTGRLRIASFACFAAHADEERHDREGMTINWAKPEVADGGKDGSQLLTVTSSGHNAYVLCGSIVQSRELAKRFDATGCLVIENSLAFSQMIKRHIPGCDGGLQGNCVYNPGGRLIHRRLDMDPLQIFADAEQADGTVSMDVLPQLAAVSSGFEQWLVKEARFASQSEYRFLWRTQNIVDGYIDVVCPEARAFCRPIPL